MIAQSMMTKLNKSEYVTIACPPSARSRNGWQEPSTSSLIKHIILLLPMLTVQFWIVRKIPFREIHDLPYCSNPEKFGFVDERTFCPVVLCGSSKGEPQILTFAVCPVLDGSMRGTFPPVYIIPNSGGGSICRRRPIAGANIGLGVRGRRNFALSDQDQREKSTLLSFALQMGINYI